MRVPVSLTGALVRCHSLGAWQSAIELLQHVGSELHVPVSTEALFVAQNLLEKENAPMKARQWLVTQFHKGSLIDEKQTSSAVKQLHETMDSMVKTRQWEESLAMLQAMNANGVSKIYGEALTQSTATDETPLIGTKNSFGKFLQDTLVNDILSSQHKRVQEQALTQVVRFSSIAHSSSFHEDFDQLVKTVIFTCNSAVAIHLFQSGLELKESPKLRPLLRALAVKAVLTAQTAKMAHHQLESMKGALKSGEATTPTSTQVLDQFVLQALIRKSSRSVDGNWRSALNLYNNEYRNIPRTAAVSQTMMSELTYWKQWEQALHLFAALLPPSSSQNTAEKDESLQSLLLQSSSLAREDPLLQALLNEDKTSFSATSPIASQCVRACTSCGRWQEATCILQQLMNYHVNPTPSLFASVIAAWPSSQRNDRLLQLAAKLIPRHQSSFLCGCEVALKGGNTCQNAVLIARVASNFAPENCRQALSKLPGLPAAVRQFSQAGNNSLLSAIFKRVSIATDQSALTGLIQSVTGTSSNASSLLYITDPSTNCSAEAQCGALDRACHLGAWKVALQMIDQLVFHPRCPKIPTPVVKNFVKTVIEGTQSIIFLLLRCVETAKAIPQSQRISTEGKKLYHSLWNQVVQVTLEECTEELEDEKKQNQFSEILKLFRELQTLAALEVRTVHEMICFTLKEENKHLFEDEHRPQWQLALLYMSEYHEDADSKHVAMISASKILESFDSNLTPENWDPALHLFHKYDTLQLTREHLNGQDDDDHLLSEATISDYLTSVQRVLGSSMGWERALKLLQEHQRLVSWPCDELLRNIGGQLHMEGAPWALATSLLQQYLHESTVPSPSVCVALMQSVTSTGAGTVLEQVTQALPSSQHSARNAMLRALNPPQRLPNSVAVEAPSGSNNVTLPERS